MTRQCVALNCSLVSWLVLFSLIGLQHAHADEPHSAVALVRVASDDTLLRDASVRLRAELKSAGFEVIEVDAVTDHDRSFATVALHRAETGPFADIWIRDHLTDKTVMRRLEVDESSGASAVLAIRALELLRASLLELAAPPNTTNQTQHARTQSAPTDVLDWVEPTLPARASVPHDFLIDTTLSVSALGLHGTGGLGAALGPQLQLSHGLWHRWFARLSFAGPLLGPDLTRAEGHANVRQLFGTAELGFATEAQPFGVFGWVGVGAFQLHVEGAAKAPARAHTDNAASLMSNLGVGAVARLGSRVALSAELSTLWLMPYPVVVIAHSDVGRAGVPSVALALALLVGL